MQVAFRRPILLPATVELAESPGAGPATARGEITFGVRDAKNGTPHLDGSVGPGPDTPAESS